VGTWELPAIGAVTAPIAVSVRPDGYIARGGVDLTQVGSLTREPLGSDRLLWRRTPAYKIVRLGCDVG